MNRWWMGIVVPAMMWGCAGSNVRAPNESADTAEYELTFTGAWTMQTHPLDYPKAGAFSGPHFSGLIGATHDEGYSIFQEGRMPTPGLERLSEEGRHSPLDREIRAAIGEGKAGMLFESGPITDQSMPVKVRLRADANHPRLSVVAMIAPSPDWFAGVHDVLLRENGSWVQSRTLTVYAWDSGGDDGTTYEAPDMDTNPKRPTMMNDAPHFMKNGERVPVGRIVIERK